VKVQKRFKRYKKTYVKLHKLPADKRDELIKYFYINGTGINAIRKKLSEASGEKKKREPKKDEGAVLKNTTIKSINTVSGIMYSINSFNYNKCKSDLKNEIIKLDGVISDIKGGRSIEDIEAIKNSADQIKKDKTGVESTMSSVNDIMALIEDYNKAVKNLISVSQKHE